MKGNLKRVVKLFIIMAIIFLVFLMTTTVYAEAFDFSGAIDAVKTEEGVAELNSSATNILGTFLKVCKYVAVGMAMIMITMIAAKYMLASAGDRADIKKHAIAYVTGAVILFASSAIIDILEDFAGKTIDTAVGS